MSADRSRAATALTLCLLVVALLSVAWPASSVARAAAPRSKAIGLSVTGSHLVNAHGQRVRLLGFNNSGAEYACIEG